MTAFNEQLHLRTIFRTFYFILTNYNVLHTACRRKNEGCVRYLQ